MSAAVLRNTFFVLPFFAEEKKEVAAKREISLGKV
jgi:hypothetical protein